MSYPKPLVKSGVSYSSTGKCATRYKLKPLNACDVALEVNNRGEYKSSLYIFNMHHLGDWVMLVIAGSCSKKPALYFVFLNRYSRVPKSSVPDPSHFDEGRIRIRVRTK
jgi:hypothetical protein